jgi:ABC-type phosphate/phosphonate transport system substrate-binding protein
MIMGNKTLNRAGFLLLGIVLALIFFLINPPRTRAAEYELIFHDPAWGFSNSVEAIERLTPFCDFLGQYFDQPIRPIYLKRENALESYLAKPGVIMGFINANIVTDKKDSAAIEPLFSAIRNGRTTHTKVLLAPNRDQFSDIYALKGKRLVILSTDASTLSTQLSAMCSMDMDSPSEFFSAITPTSSTHSAVFALAYGLSDAAFTTLDSFEQIRAQNPAIGEHFKILYTAESNPNGLFVQIGKRISKENNALLATALSALPESGNGQSLLAGLSMSGFESLREDRVIASNTPPLQAEQASTAIPENEEPAVDKPTEEIQSDHKPASPKKTVDTHQLVASKNSDETESEQTDPGTHPSPQTRPEPPKSVKKEMVAVGMLLSEHPPHRSRRALLTHRAPALGDNAKTLSRVWVADTGKRDPFCDKSLHTIPGQFVLMTAAAKHFKP